MFKNINSENPGTLPTEADSDTSEEEESNPLQRAGRNNHRDYNTLTTHNTTAEGIQTEDVLTYHDIIKDWWDSKEGDPNRGYFSATCFVSAFYVIPVYQLLYYQAKVGIRK
jgi:hypothetical protein